MQIIKYDKKYKKAFQNAINYTKEWKFLSN